MLINDYVVWQPRFNFYDNYNTWSGPDYRDSTFRKIYKFAFYPLVRFDRQYVHKSHKNDVAGRRGDFGQWLVQLTSRKVHPEYRLDFQRWKQGETGRSEK